MLRLNGVGGKLRQINLAIITEGDGLLSSLDVIQLTQDIVAIKSESQVSNAQVSDFLQETLARCGFEVERLEYLDDNGERKVSLVAKKVGDTLSEMPSGVRSSGGSGGLGFFSHSDTVPGEPGEWEPFNPIIEDGRLIGRGSCDMKGPLAATIVAAADIDPARLRHPLFIVVTADEEVGFGGAYQVAAESQLLKAGWPEAAIIAEPTRLIPVYAHKGGIHIFVTAYGRAAHSSTDKGVSANFLIAPFLAEMAELATLFRRDERYMNHEFDPPTNGFNMVLDDGNCKTNVTAAKTVCTLSIRTMPNDNHEQSVAMIVEKARKYKLEVTQRGLETFYIEPQAEVVQAALKASGVSQAETVPYGTEASVFQKYVPCVVLGPGNIAQAHTVGEWIDLAELSRSVEVYRRMIERFCL
jgi:acetylornithine deacetylase